MEKNEIFPINSFSNADPSNPGAQFETQSAKIRAWRNDPKIRMFLFTNLKNQISVLKLEVVSLENIDCELDEEDIKAVFENFGTITEVRINTDGKAFIIFNEILDAYFAQTYLNNREIEEDKIKLKVDWCTPTEIQENGLKVPKKEITEESKGVNSLILSEAEMQLMQNLNSNKIEDLGVPSNNKLTCRYNIQIDNEKDFQVARRIIGPKGCHMKRIIDSCIKDAPKEMTNTSDLIKLRLRGRGSGYKEGADKQESQEPLHLCLSSAHTTSYLYACKLVEEHLSNVYDEYKKYCVAYGKIFDQSLTIKKFECSNIKTLLETSKSPAMNIPSNNTININNNSINSNNNNNNNNFPVLAQKNLEEDFSKMKIERAGSAFSENEINHNKEFQNFMKKPVISEPFYPGFSKPPGMPAFNNEQSFYPAPPNQKGMMTSNKNPKMIPNNFNTFTPTMQMQNPYANYGSNLPLNNLYQNSNNNNSNNNNSINLILKDLNITEEEIKKLIEDRNKARREQNFMEADRIRNYLKSKGIALMDEKGGRGKGTEVTTWKICKLNYNNQKNGEFYAYNNSNGNPYYNEEGNNSNGNIGYGGKFLKYNP